jgi:hypothetical protein
MCRKLRNVVVVVSALVLTSMAFTELTAQESHYIGGAVKGTQVKTNFVTTTIAHAKAHVLLDSSSLDVHVDPGEVDLFVFQFDAECSLDNTEPLDPNDWVSVQARLNGLVSNPLGGGRSFLQPQDSPPDGLFCRGPGTHAVSKSWVVRLNGGPSGANYTFEIWWRVVDPGLNNPQKTATLDNRIVRLTRYQ